MESQGLPQGLGSLWDCSCGPLGAVSLLSFLHEVCNQVVGGFQQAVQGADWFMANGGEASILLSIYELMKEMELGKERIFGAGWLLRRV